jgi:hypothetical protein
MSTSSEKNFNLGLADSGVFVISRAFEAKLSNPLSMPPKPRKSKRINKKQKERGFA